MKNMLSKLFRFLLYYSFSSLLPFNSYAQFKPFDHKQYPLGKSFVEVTRENIKPYVYDKIKHDFYYTDLRFDLWDLLPKQSRLSRIKQGLNINEKRTRFSGALVSISRDEIILSSGEKIHPPVARNKDDNDWYPIALANYDIGYGLILDFSPLKYQVFFSPMTSSNIRIFVMSPDGYLWDKTYKELDREYRKINNSEYFIAWLDASILGDFTTASSLPEFQQEILVDSLAISIAEFFQGTQVHLMSKRPLVNPFDPLTRMSPPFFNAMLAQYHNYAIKQIAFKGGEYILQRAQMGHYYSESTYITHDRYLNERTITKALSNSHPYELSLLRDKLNFKHHDNYFDMLCYLAMNKQLYDLETRMALRKIISSAKQDAIFISWEMEKTAKEMYKNNI
jgi:hypothetical protein